MKGPQLFQSIKSKSYWATFVFLIVHIWIIGFSIIFLEWTLLRMLFIGSGLFCLWIIDGIIIQVYFDSEFYKKLGEEKK